MGAMSKSATGLFLALVLFMVISAAFGFAGIAQLRDAQYSPFNPNGQTYYARFWYPSDSVILFLDTGAGKIFGGTIAVAVLLVSVLLCFRYGRRILGFGVLTCAAALFAVVGLSLFLHGYYDTAMH
jgi:hypothetical protein